ncbi:MAG: amidase [Actinomycetota bacterium]|nr:amidase [Actinomycetota bacterium]
MIDAQSTLADLRSALAGGEVTPLEIAQHYWDRATLLNERLNAFSWLDPGFLQRVADGASDSLPIGVKDVQAVAGQPNTKSSLLVSDEPVTESSLFVERLLAAGFTAMGRTASSELAAALTTESVKNGVTRNPWHPDATASGSSGGSAAAVAAGMVPVATGTDGAGSIRLPAVACNLVGLKVTRGLLPQRTGPWDWSSVDGFLTRTVADTAAMIELVDAPDLDAWMPQLPDTRPPLTDQLSEPVAPLRVGVLREPPNGATVDDPQGAALDDVAALLAKAGHTLVDVNPDHLQIAGLGGYKSVVAPGWSHLLDYDLTQPAHPSVIARLRAIEGATVPQFVRAVADLRAGVRTVVRRWRTDFDVLLTPLTGCSFPDHGVLLGESTRPPDSRPVSDATRGFVDWVNVIGLPAVALPTHTDTRGVPYGVQLVGGAHSEGLLLAMGSLLEDHHRWHERRLPEDLR